MRSTWLSQPAGGRAPRAVVLLVTVVAAVAAVLLPGGAAADQASQPASPEAGFIATGNFHSCAVLAGAVRCWGFGGHGALGYGNTTSIGDDDAPDAAGPVALGAGRTAVAVAAGSVHTCALLDNGTVRCWGFGGDGRLGYGNTLTIGDDETPASLPAGVNLGPGRTAKAITAGSGHTCAILEDDTVRCWGFSLDGRLGYGRTDSIGDDEAAGSAGPVNLGAGRTAKAIAAGGSHTCALLDNGGVRCWGFGGEGRLGYGKTADIGRTPDATPDTVGPVDLGVGRTATAITAGFGHTCAILDDATVRCWGFGSDGRLGTGNTNSVGDDEVPRMVAPVDLGPGRTARAIHAGSGSEHTCAILDDGSVRCWGLALFGQLGYGNTNSIGDDEVPRMVAPVELGSGRTATAISAALQHTCARLDDMSVRCWGRGANGRLGYCNELTIGDNEPPSAAGPVPLAQPGIPIPPACSVAPPVSPPPPPPPAEVQVPSPTPPPRGSAPDDGLAAALAAQRARRTRLQSCLRRVGRRRLGDVRRARLLVGSRRRVALLVAGKRAARGRAACLRREGRVPGRVSRLTAVATGSGSVRLSFRVAGTDGARQPAARRYVIKQSLRPIRTARDFSRAFSLCKGRCSFAVTRLDTTAILSIRSLRRNRVYYYAVAALDNVSGRRGPRSAAIRVRSR